MIEVVYKYIYIYTTTIYIYHSIPGLEGIEGEGEVQSCNLEKAAGTRESISSFTIIKVESTLFTNKHSMEFKLMINFSQCSQ